ncbi:MAG: HNH endonuclease [Flavobacteriaceae bacterium]|nr:HNH endonuclease [Flavobacteriaceae bacterium]MCY4268074.1 HNH endonuclease [Flavobacteriaceae bacterium]
MKFCVAVTDLDWFDFLSKKSSEGKLEDVNFWRPGGSNFTALTQGGPILFKLKSPRNVIAGIGFFTSFSRLPVTAAWQYFGKKNGFDTYIEFKNRIFSHNYSHGSSSDNPKIGNIILTDPIFFNQSQWIEPPVDWSSNIVSYKLYSTEDHVGKILWHQIEDTLNQYHFFDRKPDEKSPFKIETPKDDFQKRYLSKVRYGQSSFRMSLTNAYDKRCVISGVDVLPVLEAAHIKPYASSGPHFVSNGLLLKSDIHELFDTGYITITNEMKIEVSKKLQHKYERGELYHNRYHGQKLILPESIKEKPAQTFIDWHNQNVYNG